MNVPEWAVDKIKEAEASGGDWENWEPEPGDTLSGKVVRWDEAETKYGVKPTLKVQVGETEYSVLVGRIALKSQLEKAAKKIKRDRLAPGDDVVIVYHGLRESASGNQYHDYVAAARRGTPTDNDNDGLPF